MAVYLVGQDNKTFFKSRTNWDFKAALEAASAGDTIEIEEGFSLAEHLESITIDKSIEIVGNTFVDDCSKNVVFDKIPQLFIKNGAKVTVKNVWIETYKDENANIKIRENASLLLKNVVISKIAEASTNYPIIYSENATVEMDDVFVYDSHIKDGKHRIYGENSTFKIKNSTIKARVVVNKTELNCEDALIQYEDSNTVFAENNSKLNFTNVILNGGKISNKNIWPCVRILNSQLYLEETKIIQPNCSSALNCLNSTVNLINNEIDSAKFDSSTVGIFETKFIESVCVTNNSKILGVEGKNSSGFSILGRDNGAVNLFVEKKSVVDVGDIGFGNLSSPNIKLERNVTFTAEKIFCIKYDLNAENLIILDNNGNSILSDTVVPEIDYFGDMTAYDKLQQMVGLATAKEDIDEFVALTQMNKLRAEQGLNRSDLTLHSLFLGNPGTGKTTVARILGSLLHEKGIIKSDKYVETSRSDLVGQYIGQTAIKTREILESALGGVLFIDEAYALASEDGGKDFGIEAINEILKFMEDHRDNIVIIFAGYTNQMQKFLQMNEGLRSRIPNTFYFEDYTIEELIIIGLDMLNTQNYQIDETEYSSLVQQNFGLSNDNSNGRWIRNLNELLLRKHAVSLMKNPSADLSAISNEVINEIKL